MAEMDFIGIRQGYSLPYRRKLQEQAGFRAVAVEACPNQ